ncbi:MAG TPA: type II toxin-antitoxin system VapC family toxin [Terriglobales bacterium]|nr:type II toxin-antitoxin system VapC family toxin [Terriglobales bacterium]
MIILDTNVLSELMKTTPHAAVVAWTADRPATELFTTSITEAEIFFGIELLSKGRRRDVLIAAAQKLFEIELAGRVFPFESEAARECSKIAAHRRSIGRPISQADAQIAAIAQVRRAQLATRDADGFADCGVDVTSPWEAP